MNVNRYISNIGDYSFRVLKILAKVVVFRFGLRKSCTYGETIRGTDTNFRSLQFLQNFIKCCSDVFKTSRNFREFDENDIANSLIFQSNF